MLLVIEYLTNSGGGTTQRHHHNLGPTPLSFSRSQHHHNNHTFYSFLIDFYFLLRLLILSTRLRFTYTESPYPSLPDWHSARHRLRPAGFTEEGALGLAKGPEITITPPQDSRFYSFGMDVGFGCEEHKWIFRASWGHRTR